MWMPTCGHDPVERASSRQFGLKTRQAGGGPAAETERALRCGDGDRLLYITDGCCRDSVVGERFTAEAVQLGFEATVAVGIDDAQAVVDGDAGVLMAAG